MHANVLNLMQAVLIRPLFYNHYYIVITLMFTNVTANYTTKYSVRLWVSVA